ncbi:hypothetical protein TYRP_003018 [Tyrophagus putrescentiae]|nr:hypothetical protein TYRP_003018 [Tyrophagus putrescentiae]
MIACFSEKYCLQVGRLAGRPLSSRMVKLTSRRSKWSSGRLPGSPLVNQRALARPVQADHGDGHRGDEIQITLTKAFILFFLLTLIITLIITHVIKSQCNVVPTGELQLLLKPGSSSCSSLIGSSSF